MRWVQLITLYFGWHYSVALRGLYSIWANFNWFTWNFFSIGLLFRSWFSPWKRMQERYRGGIDFQNLFETVVVNLLMRIVGFGVRGMVMVMGLAALLFLFLAGVFAFLGWLFLPVIIISLTIIGVQAL